MIWEETKNNGLIFWEILEGIIGNLKSIIGASLLPYHCIKSASTFIKLIIRSYNVAMH